MQQFLDNAKPKVTYRQTPKKRAVAADRNLLWIDLMLIFGFSMIKCTRKPTTQSYLVKNLVSQGRLICISILPVDAYVLKAAYI